MMSWKFDPSWGIPLLAMIVAGAGWLWGYLSDKSFTRKFGRR